MQSGTFRRDSLAFGGTAVAPLLFTEEERNAIYREMLRVGLFNYPVQIRVDRSRIPAPEPSQVTFVQEQDRLVVRVRGEVFAWTSAIPAISHRLTVTHQGNETTVAWSDEYIGPAYTREIEGTRSVARIVQSIVQRKSEAGQLSRQCRPPE